MRTLGPRAALSVAAALWLGPHAVAASDQNDLFDLSVEELVNLEVTSVSRKSERLADASAAVFVITRDDIRRHGVRSIPDALRLAPGLAVLQIDANKWSISARGFGGRFANKLLVLMDGRLLYTPTFSGVFWDVQHTLIDEIERIEVIRGPGASAWGTNAVNGVINIITKRAEAASGGGVVAGLDPEGAPLFAVQQSGSVGDDSAYRAFAKYVSAPANTLTNGADGNDDWDMLRAGVRVDTALPRGELTLNAEAYTGNVGQSVTTFAPQPPTYQTIAPGEGSFDGAFVMANWTRQGFDGSSTAARAYVDYTDRDVLLYVEQRTTVSLDLQHQRQFGNHDVIAGGWLRFNRYDIEGSAVAGLLSDVDRDYVVSGFVQDDITVIPERLTVTAGLRLEHADLSPDGLEWMPTLRATWKPDPAHTVWIAATRAVRTPSIGDQSSRATDVVPALPPGADSNPFPLPLRARTIGLADFESEHNVALEAGWRAQLHERLSVDVALFSMDFSELRATVPTGVVCNPSGVSILADPSCLFAADSVVAEQQIINGADARVSGGEIVLDWMALSQLRVRASVSHTREDGEVDAGVFYPEGYYPEWQGSLRTEWSPTDAFGVALLVRYVDEIPVQAIDDYWQGAVNLRWDVSDRWALSGGVRNLFGPRLEYISELGDVAPTEIDRSAYLNVQFAY